MNEHAQAKVQIEQLVADALIRAGDPPITEVIPHLIVMATALIDIAASLRVISAHKNRIITP